MGIHKLNIPQLQKLTSLEEERQRSGLELIPSENYVSQDVLSALGSVFTNKYSEGYPGYRYYGGQVNTDYIETVAIDGAKKLFGADHANVQPHSGAPANMAAYSAWLEPGDTIMGMDLTHGGHLTHGHPVTFMSKIYNFVRYKMKDIETGEIDFDHMLNMAKKHKPKILLAGFTSYPRDLDYSKFKQVADQVGAIAMADIAHTAGLIAARVQANPFDSGFQIVTSTTHKTLRGPRGGMILTKGQVSNPMKPVDKTVNNLPTLIDRQVFPALQGGPHMNNILAKAVAFEEAAQPEFKSYASNVVANAKELASQLMARGFKLITNGTDNHMIVADVVASFGIDGKQAEEILDKVGLNTNKNSIPDDPNPPFKPSGIRLGTPAVTTRGLTQQHMEQLAVWMHAAIMHRADAVKIEGIARQVADFSRKFPLPSDN